MAKKYAIKEAFYTLQGEGYHTGRPAVFLRFSGCNLWSGLEKDRSTAICKFCDTNFWGTDGKNGGKYTLDNLIEKLIALWPKGKKTQHKFIVCTGGEPMLQLDADLIEALHHNGFEVAVETNGTIEVPVEIDWICVSPKAGSDIIQHWGDELKLVHPQSNANPEDFENWEFEHFFLQPMDGPETEENTRICLDYCLENPLWKLSLQIHKILNIP